MMGIKYTKEVQARIDKLTWWQKRVFFHRVRQWDNACRALEARMGALDCGFRIGDHISGGAYTRAAKRVEAAEKRMAAALGAGDV